MGWWDIPLEGHPMDTAKRYLLGAAILELLLLAVPLDRQCSRPALWPSARPTPGIVSSRLLVAFDRCQAMIRRSIRFVAVIALLTVPALGRDLDGRYGDAPLREWFNHLASQKGPCCSFADGYFVEDADWNSSTCAPD
jgi:hypothetical protein